MIVAVLIINYLTGAPPVALATFGSAAECVRAGQAYEQSVRHFVPYPISWRCERRWEI